MYLDLIGNIDFLSVGIAIASMTIIGFSVLFNNYKNTTNRAFFYFVILAALWGFFNLMSYRITNNIGLAFLFLKIELFLGVWYVFAIFRLFYIFPEDTLVVFPFWYKAIVIPLVSTISLLTFTPLVFSGVSSVSSNGVILTLKTGPAIMIFGLTVIGLLVVSFLTFFKKMKDAPKEEKNKFSLLLIGSLITFSLIISLIFILPAFLNNSDFVPFGAIFTLPFIIFASYAIIRHKLFNLKVAGTTVLVFALSIVSFVEVTQTRDIFTIIYRSLVLVLVLVFGILLIRGVLREVKHREKTEELNKELDKAYTAQKRANETLEVFMTGLQHDIRGYLTPMVGAPSALLSGDGAFGSKTKKGILLNDNGVRLVKIVGSNAVAAKDQADDFMAIAQQRTGKSIVSLDNSVDIVAMVDEIVNFTRSQLRDRDLEVEFSRPDESWMVPADSTKLKSALRNVIGNAVKYTQKGKVAVALKKEDNGKVLISVKDSGMGLTFEEINSLFKSPFERTEEARKMTGGTGFGLYFSTLIIGLHNGKIWAESKGKGMGSTFFIELPVSKEEKVSAQV